MRNRWRGRLVAAPLLAAGVALIAACGSSTSPPASSSTSSPPGSTSSGAHASSVTIMTHSTGKGTVLSNAQGKTLYWFAIDTSTSSMCTGTCATYWPPVIGTPSAAAGSTLPHGFGTIMRSDGTTQATYDGHPLYTYASDSAAGQIGGNGLNLSGGLWWAMTPAGSKLGSASTSSGGGGYGY
ncbi:MAG: COG4315 family predicted lipoprotein [Streptosporangiaceae bacterium]